MIANKGFKYFVHKTLNNLSLNNNIKLKYIGMIGSLSADSLINSGGGSMLSNNHMSRSENAIQSMVEFSHFIDLE